MDDEFSFLSKRLRTIKADLTDDQINQFYMYYKILIEKNQVMNLTTITDFVDVVEKHFIDSLIVSEYFDFDSVSSLIDVGSGAGFPGIPLKIAFPHLSVTLLDSLGKRVNFLTQLTETLGCSNIKAVHIRAEDAGRLPEFREQYDVSVSRAVSNLASLAEYCLPFTKINGCFISYKSTGVKTEVEQARKAIHLLGGKTDHIHEFTLPGTDNSRAFVMIKKISKTNSRYPRKAGIPNRNPL